MGGKARRGGENRFPVLQGHSRTGGNAMAGGTHRQTDPQLCIARYPPAPPANTGKRFLEELTMTSGRSRARF